MDRDRLRFSLPPRPLRIVALAVFAAACTTMNGRPILDEARREYQAAQANQQVTELAPNELKQASDTLARAETAEANREMLATVEHLAYVAKQQVALAEQTARLKAAEKEIDEAAAERERLRLSARTVEADRARAEAAAAKQAAEARAAELAAARASAEATSKEAASARQQATAAQEEAKRRAAEVQAAAVAAEREKAKREALTEQEQARIDQQLQDLDAQKSERGLVITLGDVLFDAKKAQLGPRATRGLDKLAAFMQQNPERRVLVEGFTDSTGSAQSNQALSEKRADAVRRYLTRKGISGDRIETKGYGEEFPVADNASQTGRQANRRVEIVVSDENGELAPRT